MIEVPDEVRILAAATIADAAVSPILADALQEAGEDRMAHRCRENGLKRHELYRLAHGTAVTPERLRQLWRDHTSSSGRDYLPFAELLPPNWDRERLDACDLVPDAAANWAHSELGGDLLGRTPTYRFGTAFAAEVFLFADWSMQHYPDERWETGPDCHESWPVFATALVASLRQDGRYTYWSDDPDEDDEPDNVPEAYRGLLSHLFGGPEAACRELGLIYGGHTDGTDDGWADEDEWTGDPVGDWALMRNDEDWLNPEVPS